MATTKLCNLVKPNIHTLTTNMIADLTRSEPNASRRMPVDNLLLSLVHSLARVLMIPGAFPGFMQISKGESFSLIHAEREVP